MLINNYQMIKKVQCAMLMKKKMEDTTGYFAQNI